MKITKHLLWVFALLCLAVSCDQASSPEKLAEHRADTIKKVANYIPTFENSPKVVRRYITSRYALLNDSKDFYQELGKLGDALFANQFFDNAKQVYLVLMQSQPKEHRWRAMLAVTMHRLGDTEAALTYINGAAEIQPKDLHTVFYQAALNEELGNYTVSKKQYEQALSQAPDFPETNFALGKNLFNLGDYQASSIYLEKAMALAPDSSFARAQLVRLSKLMTVNVNIPDEADAKNTTMLSLPHPYYIDVMKHGRSLSDLRFNAQRAVASKNMDDAINYLDLLVASYPEDASETEFVDLAHFESTRGDLIRSKELYLKATQYFPTSSKVLLGYADLELREKNLVDAQNAYERALKQAESSKDKARAYQGLGRVTASSGDLNSAKRSLDKAVVLWPENPIFHMDLMRVHADLGDFQEAKNQLNLAEKLGYRVPVELKVKLTELSSQ